MRQLEMFCSVPHTEFASYVSLAMKECDSWKCFVRFVIQSSVRMYRWQCQFARTVTGPFCSVRHTEFSSYVSLAMSVRQNINWTVSFSSPYRTLVTRHKEGAVAKRKRRYTYIFLVLKVCDCGNAT